MRPKTASPVRLLVLAFTVLATAEFAGAQGRDRSAGPEFARFSLSMDGGFGFAEQRHGLLDVKAEFQVGLSRRVRLGLGLGYLNDEGRRGGDGRFDQGYMLYGDDGAGSVRSRIMPVSLNLYYGLPLGRKWTVFMSGGGSWYRGRFENLLGDQRKNAWGGQAGLGVEYRIASSLQLIAQADYRFVEFHGVVAHVDAAVLAAEELADAVAAGNTRVAEFLRGLLVPLAPKPVRTSDLNLSGLSLRVGVKFGL